jgi:hypothetical protein
MNGDLLGWAASALVLATFCMQGMVALRVTALASNVVFIAYGASAGIDPVLMLHIVLLPLNAWRLAQSRPATSWMGARFPGQRPEPGREIHRPLTFKGD